MSTTPTYIKGAELADLAVTWQDSDGDVIDFSTGWTFSVKVGQPGEAAAFTKTTNITAAAAAPNVTVAWSTTNELNSLDPGGYAVQITATRSADSKTRIMQTSILIRAAIT